MMATSKGVLHGYTGVAAVDSAHQIIVEAQAHGTGAEQELLVSVVMAVGTLRTADTTWRSASCNISTRSMRTPSSSRGSTGWMTSCSPTEILLQNQ